MQTITLRHGDSFAILKTIPDESLGAVVSDPPYLIGFMSREWDKAPTNTKTSTPSIDPNETEDDDAPSVEVIHAMEVFHVAWLKEVFRTLRPGGIAKVFAATRTMHRLAAAMEAVGFILPPEHSLEVWAYGSGFPKSLNIQKNVEMLVGETVHGKTVTKEDAERFSGRGTALKPAFEPFVVGRKPLKD